MHIKIAKFCKKCTKIKENMADWPYVAIMVHIFGKKRKCGPLATFGPMVAPTEDFGQNVANGPHLEYRFRREAPKNFFRGMFLAHTFGEKGANVARGPHFPLFDHNGSSSRGSLA